MLNTLISTVILLFAMNTTLHEFSLKNINGTSTDFSDYKGKVVLIVNVASFCGYTKQYASLEKLYGTYKDKGLVVIGIPSNDFGEQEPGTDEEISQFCSTKYAVTFPMFSKMVLKGDEKSPLYAWLTSGDGDDSRAGEVGWNFEKFLVGKDGRLVKRFSTKMDPLAAEITTAIEAALTN